MLLLMMPREITQLFSSSALATTDAPPDTTPVIGILGAGVGYFFLTGVDSAYQAAPSGAVIQIQGVNLSGNFDFDLSKAVVLEGGYDPAFTNNAGSATTLIGLLTIISGTVAVDNIVIQ